MKKLFYSFAILTLVFTSCDPMEDIYTEIDAVEEIIVGDAAFTLTDADYDELGLTYGSFSNINDVKSMLPDFLTDLYPVWGKGSSALIGFKLYIGSADGVSDYTSADDYRLSNSDYPAAADNAIGFYEDQNPADYIPNILSNNITSPTEGQVVLAKYKQYVGAVVQGTSAVLDADFQSSGDLLDFEVVNISGTQMWEETSSYGAKMSGYSGGAQPNEDWLVSSEIDLTDQTNLKFQVNQVVNYGSLDLLDIMISKDYTGDVTTANWDVITLTNLPSGSNWTFVLSDEYDLAAYEGETIHLAFKYQSTASEAATWEIAQATIKTPGVEGDSANKEVYYVYTGGSWEESEGVYFLSDADFDSMGTGSGQPGQYNNFSS